MPKRCPENTKSKTYPEQEIAIEPLKGKGYRTITATEAAYAAIVFASLNNDNNIINLISDDVAWTKTSAHGGRVYVFFYDDDGLGVHSGDESSRNNRIGRGLARNF